ncbi:MAG: 2-amino-4-hydroxy-6-hydroxymethyldihydropteridine diphosphokinase [Gemmatimonadaceae bacterium]
MISTRNEVLRVKDIAYVALGSNVGNRDAHLALARQSIARLPRTRILAESPVQETAPIGPVRQDPYLNQMLAIETSLAPLQLLEALHDVERSAGRERRIRWGPRTLDLDIVLFQKQEGTTAQLTIPHPELPNREFWQQEMAELDRLLLAGSNAEPHRASAGEGEE